ncbi:MAG: hypothetical protein BAJALOKI2v1_670004 [Promethearchaeota archaeon]|nr:MAG: hypothetical protein BAJALOKI2v1_670004 [Candidatus Lokiarchaeota archaeon]
MKLKSIENNSIIQLVNNLVHLAGDTFSNNERCRGCGICSRVCPVDNVEIVDEEPVWLDDCENFLTCDIGFQIKPFKV